MDLWNRGGAVEAEKFQSAGSMTGSMAGSMANGKVSSISDS